MGATRMIGAMQSYRELMTSLFFARLEAGGTLSQEDEARFAGALDRCWNAMSEEEQDAIEKEIATGTTPTVNQEPDEDDREVGAGSTLIPRTKRAA